jgi:hypothetical protein
VNTTPPIAELQMIPVAHVRSPTKQSSTTNKNHTLNPVMSIGQDKVDAALLASARDTDEMPRCCKKARWFEGNIQVVARHTSAGSKNWMIMQVTGCGTSCKRPTVGGG